MEKKTRLQKWLKLSCVMMIFAMILSFTGCIRYKMAATVHKDGTVDIEILYAALDSGKSVFDEQKIKATKEHGWIVEDYQEETSDGYTYIGYTIRKNAIKLEDMANELLALDLGFDGFSLAKDGEEYVLNWDASEQTAEATNGGSSLSFGGYIKFVLNVPGAIGTNNASSVKGKTLEWDLLEKSAPFCKFKLTGGGLPIWAIVGLIILGIGAVVGVVLLVLWLRKRKKERYIPTYRTRSELAAIDANERALAMDEPTLDDEPKSLFAAPIDPAFLSETDTALPETAETVEAVAAETTYNYDHDILKPEVKLPVWAKPLSKSEMDALNDENLDDQ